MPGSENEHHGVGCHSAFALDGKDGFEGAWAAKKLRYGIEEWTWLGGEASTIYTKQHPNPSTNISVQAALFLAFVISVSVSILS